MRIKERNLVVMKMCEDGDQSLEREREREGMYVYMCIDICKLYVHLCLCECFRFSSYTYITYTCVYIMYAYVRKKFSLLNFFCVRVYILCRLLFRVIVLAVWFVRNLVRRAQNELILIWISI
jgi:hypothetical protein